MRESAVVMSLPKIRRGASRQTRTEGEADRRLRWRNGRKRKRSPGEKRVPLITPLVNPSQPLSAWFGGQVGTPERPETV